MVLERTVYSLEQLEPDANFERSKDHGEKQSNCCGFWEGEREKYNVIRGKTKSLIDE